MTSSHLSAALTFTDAEGSKVGEKRIRLLEAIDETGSISAAAKSVGLSYKAAWDAVNMMNNLFPSPLVMANAGGKKGGGASLTRDARQVLDAYAVLQSELSKFLVLLEDTLQNPAAPTLSSMLWSFIMRTSARNALRGTVTQMVTGGINTEVTLSVSDTSEIVAVVTNRSIETLGLGVGKQAFAMIKASFVILAHDDGLRTSARNQIKGTISAIETGSINDEVTLDIGDGKTLAAVITQQSTGNLDFKVGDKACALIKASHVILGVD
ncbi:MAG: TOBE domain-containing protein [Sneathiella sp.]